MLAFNLFHSPSRNDNIIPALQNILKSEPLQFQIAGHCMAPLIQDKARIIVAAKRVYWPGDIVLYATKDSQIVTHRLLGYYPSKTGWKAITQGDNSARPDAGIPVYSILGRLFGGQCSNLAVDIPLGKRFHSIIHFLLLCCFKIWKRFLLVSK